MIHSPSAALEQLAGAVRSHSGLRSKQPIQDVARQFGHSATSAWTETADVICNGDDAAAIVDGNGYLLVAAEGLQAQFVRQDPWFAGFCSVMVNVNDIAAMGGVPYAVTDVLFAGSDVDNRRVLAGMRDAAAAFGVPIVGGHTGQSSGETWLSVAIVGRARRLLSTLNAKPGDAIVCAVDLRGAYRGHYDHFNAATAASREQLRHQIRLLSQAAELELAHAAKDISQAGVAGTLVMLCEGAGLGAVLDLERLPLPHGVDLRRWLLTFPSFGYLLTTPPDKVSALQRHFQVAGIAAATVGHLDTGRQVRLALAGHEALLWDVAETSLTGFGSAEPDAPHDVLPLVPRKAS